MVPYYMINSMFMDSKAGSFSDLNNDINGNDDDEITLLKQYVFNIDKDSSFIHGVPINRNVIINGVGITIDGANMARLFDIGPNACVKFLNLNFINGNASGKDTYGHGGAIYAPYKGTCIMEKCTFTNNTAEFNGGAVFGGNAIGCTFTGNSATFGGAMSDSDASNSIFNNNTAGTDGGALFKSDAEKCDFNFNSAGCDGGVMYYGTADKCNFNRNSAQRDAGVLYYGTANNCTFSHNTGNTGGAMRGGTANNCNFYANYAYAAGAIEVGNANYCNFTCNSARNKAGAMWGGSSNNCIFINLPVASFTDLEKDINGNDKDEITLARYYLFSGTDVDDSPFRNGVPVNRNVTINGNGMTIDGAYMAGLFEICEGACVKFLNINFINGYKFANGGAINAPNANCAVENSNFTNIYSSRYGGALYNINAINCNFNSNKAHSGGGAMYQGTAINCAFNGNSALGVSGALHAGTAINCSFYGSSAINGGAMSDGIAINSTFHNNRAEYKEGGALNGCNATGCIFVGNYAYNQGGAVNGGKSINCTFNKNSAGIMVVQCMGALLLIVFLMVMMRRCVQEFNQVLLSIVLSWDTIILNMLQH